MNLLAFLLAAVGVALSTFYSGAFDFIAEHGSDFSWLKDFATLSPDLICALTAGVLATLGAFCAFFAKKLSMLLLLLAAAAMGWGIYSWGVDYPYAIAAPVLFLLAMICASRIPGSRKVVEEEELADEKEILPELFDDMPQAAAAAEPVADQPQAERVEAGPVSVETVIEELEAATPVYDDAAKVDVNDGEKKHLSVWGLLLSVVLVGCLLYFSGVWEVLAGHGLDWTWLKDPASYDAKTAVVLSVSALALLGGLISLGRSMLATEVLVLAAAVAGAAEAYFGSLYQYSWGAIVACLVVALCMWACADRKPCHYTGAYVFGCILGLVAAAAALHFSGVGTKLCGDYAHIVENVLALDSTGKLVVLTAVLGVLGAILSLLGIRLSAWLLLIAMLVTLAAELLTPAFYANSWIVLLIFALAATLAGAIIHVGDRVHVPVKRLTLGGALLLAVIALALGAGAMWRYNQTVIEEKLRAARAADPAYQQVENEVTARDAQIQEMDVRLREQGDLVAERDSRIEALNLEATSKDEEIARLTAETAERDATIAEIRSQLDGVNAQLSEAQARLNRRYVFVSGRVNVRDVPNSGSSSRRISQLTNEVVEMLDVTHPAGSSADWYQVRGSFGVGWIFGRTVTRLSIPH